MGNFCSWNCAKSYAHSQGKKPPEGVHYLWMLSFLTVHRPKYCSNKTKSHKTECECLLVPSAIQLAPPKEQLKSFGGNMEINEYRKGFLIIEKYEWVNLYFIRKDYQYTFMELCEPRKQTHKDEECILPPKVYGRKRRVIQLLDSSITS